VDEADDEDGSGFHLDCIAELEVAVAALTRQLDRAASAADGPAVAVEREAICERVRELVYHHLGCAVGETSDDWVWLSGVLDGWAMERPGPTDLSASGQVWCSLPEGGWRDWAEPFAAWFRLSADGRSVAGYALRFGRRSTLHDLPAVRAGIVAGSPPPPCLASEVPEWAYVFSKQAEPVAAPDPAT
jgi:hypothetical protein